MASFLILQQELGAQTGLDQTISAQATLLKRWLNNAQQIILRSFEWPFLRSPTPLVIQTVPDYSTGTVATTAGSTSITFSTAPKDVNGSNVSVSGYFIQTSSSKDWYKITAHTSGTTAATLEIAAITTAAAATLTIRKMYYSTSSNVDQIIQIFQDVLPYQLLETSPEYFQSFNPGFLSTGTPRIFMPAGVDSSAGAGVPQFRLWPNPDSVLNLRIDYLTVATDMSADADISVIPAKWHTTTLLEGAKAQGYSFLDDSRYGTSVNLFNAMIEEMKTEYENSLHRHRVMTAADNQPVGGNLGYMPLPFNYPRNS
jgi:hypothetical protein